MTRLFEVATTARRSLDALGIAGQSLLAAAALFAAMSLYGWRQGMMGQALNIGLLAVALFCVFLVLLVARGWVGPWLVDRVGGQSFER